MIVGRECVSPSGFYPRPRGKKLRPFFFLSPKKISLCIFTMRQCCYRLCSHPHCHSAARTAQMLVTGKFVFLFTFSHPSAIGRVRSKVKAPFRVLSAMQLGFDSIEQADAELTEPIPIPTGAQVAHSPHPHRCWSTGARQEWRACTTCRPSSSPSPTARATRTSASSARESNPQST